MPRQIPASDLLLHCGQPLTADGRESRDGIFHYANSTVNALLKEEAYLYKKLKLSIFDGVLAGRHTIAALTRKKYPNAAEQLCACVLLDLLTRGKPLFIYKIMDDYALSPPIQITAELFGNTQGMEKLVLMLKKSSSRHSPSLFGSKRHTNELRLKVSVSLMRSAFDNLRFISRFNEETFFRGISDKDFSYALIDLSDKSVRSGFTMLYAVTFFGLSADDLFNVDSVFGFTNIGVRSKDDMRPKAAAELLGRIRQDDIDGIAEMADEMSARLLELPLPDLDVNDPITLAKNCTLYAGLSQMGKAYIAALSPVETVLITDTSESFYRAAKQRAELLSQYDRALALCQGILTLLTMKKPQLSSLKAYSQALQLQQQIEKEIR